MSLSKLKWAGPLTWNSIKGSCRTRLNPIPNVKPLLTTGKGPRNVLLHLPALTRLHKVSRNAIRINGWTKAEYARVCVLFVYVKKLG